MMDGPKRIDLGLGKPKEAQLIKEPLPDNAMSLFEFRNRIFHGGIERTVEGALSTRSIHQLAVEFEGTYNWAEKPSDSPEIIEYFENQLNALIKLSSKISEEPELPQIDEKIGSFGLTVFPVAEHEFDQVRWDLTSSVKEFHSAVAERTNLMRECDFVLPQGGYYFPTHFRIGLTDAEASTYKVNQSALSEMAVELFLLSVSFERGSHVLRNGYSTLYLTPIRANKPLRSGYHELVTRIPALYGELSPLSLMSPAIEVRDCIKDKNPTSRANGRLKIISDIVNEYTEGDFSTVSEMLRNSRKAYHSEQYSDLISGIFTKLKL